MFGEEAPWIASAIASLRDQDAASRLVGASPRFRKAIERLPAIARASATVVITGEPGTGKTLVARGVHYLGPRAGRAFVPIRCTEQADDHLELDLCEADGGTVFVDRVDRLAPRAQGALVCMLQAADRSRLADGRHGPDVRFIVGAGTPLPALVKAGRIRRDLYQRLSVLTINLPPLRERGQDILRLARHFLAGHDGHSRRTFGPEAERVLLAYRWPGNVRELEEVVRRAAASTAARAITAGDLGIAPDSATAIVAAPLVSALADGTTPLPPFSEAKRAAVDAFERGYLERLLRMHGGNVSGAARSARKERRDLGRLLKKHQLDRREFWS